MIKEVSASITICDCCGVEIPRRTAYRNDGSLQSDSLKIKNLDMCLICAARVLHKFQDKLDVTESELNGIFDTSHKLDAFTSLDKITDFLKGASK